MTSFSYLLSIPPEEYPLSMYFFRFHLWKLYVHRSMSNYMLNHKRDLIAKYLFFVINIGKILRMVILVMCKYTETHQSKHCLNILFYNRLSSFLLIILVSNPSLQARDKVTFLLVLSAQHLPQTCQMTLKVLEKQFAFLALKAA